MDFDTTLKFTKMKFFKIYKLILCLQMFIFGIITTPLLGQQVILNSGSFLKNAGANIVVNGNIANAGSMTGSGTPGINITGDLTNTGIFNLGTVICIGTTPQLISGNNAMTFNSLTIDNAYGVTLTNTALTTVSGSLTINNGKILELASGRQLTIAGSLINSAGNTGLILKSDAGGTASVICSTTGVDAKVERFLTHSKWHYIGMPVESGVAGVFHLPSGHSDIYLRTHIESSNSWTPNIVTGETELFQGRGYEVWVGGGDATQDETVVFPGKLNAGNYTTGAGNFYNLEYTDGHGLNLICNPYPSALMANIDTWSKSSIANSIWTWSDVNGNYVYWNGLNGTNGDGYGTMTGGVIPSMQGFFVLATGSSPSITIPQTDRVHDSQSFYKESETLQNTFRIDVTGNDYQDALFVRAEFNTTENYDPQMDVQKLFGLDYAPQIYTLKPGNKLSIITIPDINDDRNVQMGFECSVPGNFTLEASEMEGFDSNVEIYLDDLLKGITSNLRDDPVYTFNHDLNADPNRFVIHFANINAISENNLDNFKIYSYNDIVYVQNPLQKNGLLKIYDMMGKEIMQQDFHGESELQLQIETQAGFYLVRVQTSSQLITQKVFLK